MAYLFIERTMSSRVSPMNGPWVASDAGEGAGEVEHVGLASHAARVTVAEVRTVGVPTEAGSTRALSIGAKAAR